MNKVLILAAGGGYDILTVHLLAWQLKKSTTEVHIDIAGMLNPKFRHFYFSEGVVEKEKAVCRIGRKKAVRFKYLQDYYGGNQCPDYNYCKKNLTERDFLDGRLSVESEFELYNFSLLFGIDEQIDFLRNYDKVYICDVGGDILYSGKNNSEIKTPIIDAYTLMLARRFVETGGCAEMCIISPGSDMELTPEHIGENLMAVDAKMQPLDVELVKHLWELYKKIGYGDSGKTLRRLYAASVLMTPPDEIQKYGVLIGQECLCDIFLAIRLNPLADAESYEEILEKYRALNN